MHSLVQDLRYGLRQLAAARGFTAVAVLSLALGIGANTAIFQLVDAVRLRTLPVKEPQELVSIDFRQGSQRSGWFSTRSARLTYAQWEQIQAQQQAFSGVLAWSASRFSLTRGGETRYAEGLFVSGGFFDVLGVPPIMGRAFTREEDKPGCANPGAVLAYGFWQRQFGGAANVLERNVELNGHRFPIQAVMPPSFFGVEVGRYFDVAIPICADSLFAKEDERRMALKHAWWLSAMGRLKPGWTEQKASAHLEALSPAIMQATLPPVYKPDTAKRYLANKLAATSGSTGVSGLRRQYEQPLWLLLATTALVLLIACANIANLLLARASARQRELSVRLAVGASRSRLVRQLLAESLLLAAAGAALGAGLAQVISRGLVAFLSTENSPLFVGIGLDARVLGFTAAVAALTCLLFGLVPAWRATSIAPASALKGGGRGATTGRDRLLLRRGLVASQVALSLVLLIGALLFIRSLHNVLSADAGFNAEGILTVSIDLREAKYSEERIPLLHRELLAKLSAESGVISAAQVGFLPVSGSGWNNTIGPDGTRAAASGKEAFFNRAGPGYFKTMGTPILAGRDFDDRDTRNSPKVAIVNQEFAKRFFNGANPVGRTFNMEAEAGKPETLFQIVGLVKNTKYYQLRENPMAIAFLPVAEEEKPGEDASFVLRIGGSPTNAVANVKRAIAEISPAIGMEFRMLSRQIDDSLLRDRLMATLSGAFGLLAGLLATIGLYGVIAYTVARRRNEIGVRIALGAGWWKVVGMVLKEASLLVAVGLIAGALLSLWAGKAVAAMLYGATPHDVLTMIAAMLVLATVALAASYGPARRAASMDPMAALREE